MSFVTINPATGDRLQTYEAHDAAAVEARLAAATAAQRRWRFEPPATRGAVLGRLAGVLRGRAAQNARLITCEMGKPLAEASAEIEKCAVTCDFYAQNAEIFLAPERVETSALESLIAYEPLGVVLGIMPWNYPFWQAVRFLAPALLGGNAALLKHADNVPGCALALEAALKEAGGAGRSVLDPPDPDRRGEGRDRGPARLCGQPDGLHRGGRHRRRPGRGPGSSRRCWSSGARTPSSCWPTPTWIGRSRPR